MNRKTFVFHSKIVFIGILIFILCCSTTINSWAAKKTDFYSFNERDYIKLLNKKSSHEDVLIGPVLGLSADVEFRLLEQRRDFNKITHYRYQQTYKGIPVWGINTIISRDTLKKVVKLHGSLVRDIRGDIRGFTNEPALNPLAALKRMQKLHQEKEPGTPWYFSNEKYGTYIYLDKNEKVHLCNVVSFFADSECGNPSQNIYFIDVVTGKILHSFDMLNYANGIGPGGNLKVGYYYYGIDYPPFSVIEDNGTCTMTTPDVKTVDLNHGTTGTTAYSYTCYENTHEEVNDAYCPLNDAHFFGQVVCDMYNNWYGVPPVPFQITIKCHYSTNYEGAFWDGANIILGDGNLFFYPLVGLDVISHEASHGFTQHNSDLIFSSQSGGINEAFSDSAGEAAEYYLKGTNDFMVGYDIWKNPTGAIRYMYDPPLDGYSIDHIDDYYEGLDVRYSSGIFNKVFYLMATTPGWTTQMAFDTFVKANQDYWGPITNFQQGAECVIDAVGDYGYPCQDAADAFASVGISVYCPLVPEANFTASATVIPEGESINFTDLSTNNPDTWEWTFKGGTPASSTQQNPTVTYNYYGTYTVTLTASNAAGSDTEVKVDYISVVTPCTGTLTNPGFETGTFSGWTSIGDVSITSDSHTGSYAAILNGAGSSIEQVVDNLCTSTVYTVSCWGKAKAMAGVYLGVKNYGGEEQTVQFTDFKNFVKKSITFITGASNNSVTIFVIKLENKMDGIADDFEIVRN